MAAFIWDIQAPCKFLSRPQFIFLYFYSNGLPFSKELNYKLIEGENHVCVHLVDYLLDRTIEIPFAAFLPKQAPEVIYIIPLS